MKTLALIACFLCLSASAQKKITKTDAEWKKELSPAAYLTLRKQATDPPNSGKYTDLFDKGTYVCGGCGLPLFKSENKYHSGTGWPAFDRPITGSVELKPDHSHGMDRTEVICSRCGGHLGHRFDDGPLDTTGKRYCINSTALKFVPKK